MPRQDRWHRKPTPTLGGIAIFIAFLMPVVGFQFLGSQFSARQWVILIGPLMMFVMGLWDDLSPLNPVAKLIGQLGAATVVIFFGDLTIQFFPWPIANILLTYFWLVGISNAVNLLDNMDGLAAGITLTTALILAFFAWRAEDRYVLFVISSLAGAALAFLVYNYPPAKIFMGDSGSLFLGFTLAVMAIARRTQASNVLASLGVPVLIFLLPIMDTTLVTITRLLRGQSPAQGGTDHTSHRLISFGLNERQVLFVLYGVSLLGGISAATLESLDYDISLGIIPVILIVLTLFTAYLGQLKVVITPQTTSGKISRLVVDLAYRQRIFETLFDLVLVGCCYYLSFWTLDGLDMSREGMALFLKSWVIALVSAYAVFFLAGIYRGLWRYFGINDLIRFFTASVLCGGVTWLAAKFLFPDNQYPLELMALFSIFLFLGLAGSRASFAILDRFQYRQKLQENHPAVLIYGAGDMGEALVRWLQRSSEPLYRPVGFIDEDEKLWGRAIHDVRIFGGVKQLGDVIDTLKPSGLLIASNSIAMLPEILQVCRSRKIWVKRLRIEFEDCDATAD